MEKRDILVINPGSTTTKIGVFRDLEPLFEKTVTHAPEDLLAFGDIISQESYRVDLINKALDEKGYNRSGLKGVVGRGGLIIGIKGGGYRVDDKLCEALKSPENPQHAANLGGIIAEKIARELGLPAFIYDSPTGCELTEVAKISGLAELERFGSYHVLNSKAQARNYAASIGKSYSDLRLLVCHLGGGVTVTAHLDGNIIDGASYDEGPMSPERTGGIPLLLWNNLAFSGKYTEEEAEKLICGKGGLYSYLGTTDCREVEAMVRDGNEKAAVVYEAFAYQVAKSIAQVSVALKGKVDAIILTGGAARAELLRNMIMDYAPHIGEYVLLPGEAELLALAQGADRILRGEEEANYYGR